MVEITEHDKFYWNYEYDVVAKYRIPLLTSWGIQVEGASLLDVGCGDGGGLAAFHDAGMICKGYDVDPQRVENARQLNDGRSINLTVGSIYEHPVPFSDARYDLVILNDVFEHLERKKEVLQTLKSYLAPHGKMIITFPPYYSAFGGHQQLMKTWFVRLPFVHLIPFMVSHVFPRLRQEHRPFVEEIHKLKHLKMGIRKFRRLLPPSGLRIDKKQGYIISPNHIRFGLKPLSGNFVSEIPLFGECLTSGVVYLLSRQKDG